MIRLTKSAGLLFLLAPLVALTVSTRALGDTSSSQDENATGPTNVSTEPLSNVVDKSKTPGAQAGNVDKMITNNNLRALSGSKSKISMSSTLEYLGGAINSAFSEDRPGIADAPGTTKKSDIDGQVSAKLNLDETNSFSAGIGVRWIAPMSPGGPHNFKGNTFDAMNPYVQYQKIYKLGGLQSVFQASVTQWTEADQTVDGFDKQYSLFQDSMYQVGRSRLSVGGDIWYQYQTFDKSSPKLLADQNDVEYGVAPILEYQLTDKVNLRTVADCLIFDHLRSVRDPSVFTQEKYIESVGVGYSVTRDIFLYPNVQFVPEQIEASLTNVGFQATINL